MNFTQLVKAVAGDLGNKRRAKKAIQAVARGIFYGLARDGRVAVKNLGIFNLVEFQPQRFNEGEEGDLPERSVRVSFRQAESMKTAMKRVRVKKARRKG